VAGELEANTMADRKPSGDWRPAESLIAEAQAARVRAHVWTMLSRLKSRTKAACKAQF
jgi:hypothetical protein